MLSEVITKLINSLVQVVCYVILYSNTSAINVMCSPVLLVTKTLHMLACVLTRCEVVSFMHSL